MKNMATEGVLDRCKNTDVKRGEAKQERVTENTEFTHRYIVCTQVLQP
jgi:hypothetical protein